MLQYRRSEIRDRSNLGGPNLYKDDLWKFMDRLDSSSKIEIRIFTYLIETRSGGRSIKVSSANCRHGIPGFQGPTF